MPNIHYVKFYVFAYANLYICYNAISQYASWHIKFSIYLYAKSFISYATCYMPAVMPRLVCQLICWVHYISLYAYLSTSFCMLYYMPARECQISVVRCQVSLYANLGCYMSNYYISVYMPNAMGYMPQSICKIAICQMLWPCLCLLVWLRNRLDISLYICLSTRIC
jgi:hypothetical protein